MEIILTAYVKEIQLLDDDGEDIGTLVHDCDDMYMYVGPAKNSYVGPDDFKFIAKVLESNLVLDFTEEDLTCE